MTDVQQTVSTPQESTALANGLVKLFNDILAAKKSGASGVALVTDAVTSSIADLEPALAGISNESGEIKSQPIGVVEAFVIAGMQLGRQLTNK